MPGSRTSIPAELIVQIAQGAGEAIMRVYAKQISVEYKSDHSPLTEADLEANKHIVQQLRQRFPDIPIISEETREVAFEERKHWQSCWVVDPLDGTKEFINRNGEFTVNIALVEGGEPVFGVVHVPAQGISYYTGDDGNAWRKDADGSLSRINVSPPDVNAALIVVGSRSHGSAEVDSYVSELSERYPKMQFRAAGSALKFCLVAEGSAHLYPRFGPTMEWDTAAGHAVVVAAGGTVTDADTGQPLRYNKSNLLNPFFLVKSGTL